MALENIVCSGNSFYISPSPNMSRYKVKTNVMYSAPELYSKSPYTTFSDIWNAGVLLYMLFYGKYPFSLDSEEALKNEIIHKKIEYPSNSSLSANAKKFITSILSSNERSTAVGCLEYEWFKESDSKAQDIKNGDELVYPKVYIVSQQLKYHNFQKKNIQSIFSVVNDPVFEKINIPNNTLENLTQATTPSATQISSFFKMLVIGAQDSGKNAFMEKLIKYVSKTPNIEAPRNILFSGYNVNSYDFYGENTTYKSVVINYPLMPEVSFNLKRSESEEISKFPIELKKNTEKMRKSSLPKDDILKSSSKNVSELVTREFNFKKPFVEDELIWFSDLADLNGVLFFCDCSNFLNESTVDQLTLFHYEQFLKSSYISHQYSIYGNIPVTVVINKVDKMPNLNKKLITNQFLSICSGVGVDLRSQVLFTSCFIEDSIKSVHNSIVFMDSSLHKFQDMKDTIKSGLKEKRSDMILRSQFGVKFNESYFTYLSQAISSGYIKRLELVGVKNLFQSKMMNSLLSEVRTSNITDLMFASCSFPVDSLDILCEILEPPVIQSLRLIDLELTYDCINKIISSCSQNNSICFLDLSRNKLNAENLKRISDMVISNSVLHLYISDCNLVEQGIEHLLDMLKYSDVLCTLDISRNMIPHSYLETFVSVIDSNRSLNLCNFHCSLHIEPQGFPDKLKELIKKNRINSTRNLIAERYLKNERKSTTDFLNLLTLLPSNSFTRTLFPKVFDLAKNSKNSLRKKKIIINNESLNPLTNSSDEQDTFLFSSFGCNEKDFFRGIDDFSPYASIVTKVDFSRNRLKEIPNIFSLINLECLYLASNYIESIPEGIKMLENLQILDLSFNKVTKFPAILTSLKELKSLFLHHNFIRYIKNNTLSKIEKLEVVTLQKNFISYLPLDFISKKFKKVTLSQNLFHTTKSYFYENWCNRETTLSLPSHSIEDIPFEVCFLEHLINLDLSNNKLYFLPPHLSYLKNLKKLDIRNNQLKELPPQISSLIQNLDELYLFGNTTLKLPKDFDNSQDISLKTEQIANLANFLDKFNEEQQFRNKIVINVLFTDEIDFTFFIYEFLKKNPKFCENSKNRNSAKTVTSQEMKRFRFQNLKKELQEIFVSKDLKQPKHKDGLYHNKWFFSFDYMENDTKYKVDIVGFEDDHLFSSFSNLYSENPEQFFVIISNIYGDVSDISSKIQVIKSHNKRPLIILGKDVKFKEGQKKEIEKLNMIKFSSIFGNILGVLFMSQENSKNFFSLIINSNTKLTPRVAYPLIQLEQLMEAETKFRLSFPVINYAEFYKLAEACNVKSMSDDEKLDLLHNFGSLVYFNKVIFGENNFIFLQPHLLIALMRHAMLVASKKKGLFGVSQYYSDLQTNFKYHLLSLSWVYPLVELFLHTQLILCVDKNVYLSNQFKDHNDKNKKFFLHLSGISENMHNWETMMDMWQSFEILDEEQEVSFYQDIHISEIGLKNKTPKHYERWYNIFVISYPFINKLFVQLLQIPNLQLIRLWKKHMICRIDRNTTFALGFYRGEEENFLKLRVTGFQSHKYFFVINDFIQNRIKLSIQNRSKTPLSSNHIPYHSCRNFFLFNYKTLETNLFEAKDKLPCPCCGKLISTYMIAPDLALLQFKHLNLGTQTFLEKEEIGRGSGGVIYKSQFNQNSKVVPVAIKQHFFDENEIATNSDNTLNVIAGWR